VGKLRTPARLDAAGLRYWIRSASPLPDPRAAATAAAAAALILQPMRRRRR